jgi:predicted DNA-binding transcriptional regulator AlpA
MARRELNYRPDDPLLSAKEAAPETGRAISTFWRDVGAGLLPPPYYVTPRSPRWRRSELRAAVDACRATRPERYTASVDPTRVVTGGGGKVSRDAAEGAVIRRQGQRSTEAIP